MKNILGDKFICEELTLVNFFSGIYALNSYIYNDVYTYIFEDTDGHTVVWKTSKDLGDIGYGSIITLTGKIKGESEYKGNPQTLVTRCHMNQVLFEGYTEEEYKEIKKQRQLESLADDCEIVTVSYKEYKEKYSNCETVINSFVRTSNGCTIDIIRRVK